MMKLRGDYDSSITYNIGDVVRHTDNEVYHLQHPCKAGVPPVDTRYWGKCDQMVAQCALMILDMNAEQEETIPKNLSENALMLKSSSEGSDKSFIITVDDDGEITAAELPAEGGEE